MGYNYIFFVTWHILYFVLLNVLQFLTAIFHSLFSEFSSQFRSSPTDNKPWNLDSIIFTYLLCVDT